MQEIKELFSKLFCLETVLRCGKNKNGMSLAEVVAASAVSSIIAIGSAGLIAQSRNIANFGEFQTNLDSRHTLNVQKVKNMDVFLSKIGLLGVATSTSANNCFKRKGTSCDSLPPVGFEVPPGAAVPALFEHDPDGAGPLPPIPDVINGLSSDNLIFMSVTYSVDCDPTKCNKIVIRVETRPSAPADCAGCDGTAQARGLNGKLRLTELTIPTSYLADKRSIDFTCATGGEILTKVDYKDLAGVCDNYQATTVVCSGGAVPPSSYGSATPGCYSLANSGVCANGVKVMGPLTGQPVCN